MTDISKVYKKGDRVICDSDYQNVLRGTEGIIIDVLTKDVYDVLFGLGLDEMRINIPFCWIKPWIDVEPMNVRERIQHDYSEWVDEICEVCDWKTNITIGEVQAKYSELAIKLAISELSAFASEQYKEAVNDRIKYLQSLINEPTQ
jgi:hypothetical protein